MKAMGWAFARTAAALALLAGVILVAPAAAAPPKPGPEQAPAPAAAPPNPVMTARIVGRDDEDDDAEALTISKLDVLVETVGGTAQTTVTATFLNPGEDATEGDFTFDLPPGSVVTGYALDVEDHMVEGVLVGRRQGTQAYEARVRAGIDPGLAEVTRSGAFRTRVFPIFPGKGRTVRLSFVTPIAPGGEYRLPLHSDEPVGEVSIVTRSEAGNDPRVDAPEGLIFGDDEVWRRKDAPLRGVLRLHGFPGRTKVSASRHRNGESFIEVNDSAPATTLRAPDTRRVRLYWDRSLSRRDDALEAEIGLARRYLETVKPRTVDLVLFSSDRPLLRTFEGADLPGQVAAALKAVDYDGATSLRDVLELRPPDAGQCLMFTDGAPTIDSYEAKRLRCPLYTLASAADADHALLGVLARKSGGEHLNLRALGVETALSRLTRRSLRVVAVTDGTQREVPFTLLPAGADSFRLVAPMPDTGRIVVELDGQQPRTYRPLGFRPPVHDGMGSLWARTRLAELAARANPDQKAMLRLARRYSVADGSMVFVVLESGRDYANSDIEPPDNAASKILAEYREVMAENAREAARERESRLDDIVKLWAEQKTWWEKSFAFPKEPLDLLGRDARTVREMERRNREREEARRQAAQRARPEAPAAAGPDGDTEVDAVTVTGSRIVRQDFEAISPVTTVGSEQLELTATLSVDHLIAQSPPPIAIEVGDWNPDRPYLKALEAVPSERWVEVYREQARIHGGSPAFYLDVAEWLHRKGRTDLALKVVLNAIELPDADTSTLTIVADRLMRYGDDERAVWMYERILTLEPDRPQPRRNLALALIARADRSMRSAAAWEHDPKADYGRALDLLTEVVMTPWNRRFDGIELISLMEANRIVPTVRELGGKVELDPRLIALLDTDLRIILEWNTDFTDMDLWVDEPSGERAIYNHKRTVIGGRMSDDMTGGYGPEEYLLRRAMNGQYRISANVYSTDRLNPNGSTTIRARIFRNWGRPNQVEETLELELKPGEDGTRLVGTITVGPPS